MDDEANHCEEIFPTASDHVVVMRALIEWIAKRSELYARTKRELDAAVEYHTHYRHKIDIELGEPRDYGDMLSNHLGAIRRLKKSA